MSSPSSRSIRIPTRNRRRRLGLAFLVWMVSPSGYAQWAPDVEVVRALPRGAFAWSPDGARLAFADGQDLWVVGPEDWQGGRRLTSHHWDPGGEIAQIVWSPDGTRLAVVAPRRLDQWDSIWRVDLLGGQVKDLLPPDAPADFGSPGVRALRIGVWPDDRWLAFWQHCGPGCGAVHRIDLARRDYQHYCVAGLDGGVAWDPAGRWAIFGGHLGALGVIDLWRVGSTPWTDCATALPPYDPTTGRGVWYAFEAADPDGRLVALRRYADRSTVDGLVRWDLSREPTPLAEGAVLPAWSPDGRHIAFVTVQPAPPPSTGGGPQAALALLELAGTVRHLAVLGRVDARRPVEEWGLGRPVWAPDGRRVAVQDLTGRLLLVDPDHARHRVLMQGPPVRLAWARDPAWLIVRIADVGVPEIGTPYLIRVPRPGE